MRKDQEALDKRYKEIMEEDKDKTFMDLLPAEFKNYQRSVIKRRFLQVLEDTTNYLNQCEFYEGRVFDKKEVVRYTLESVDNYALSIQIIPIKNLMGKWIEIYSMPEYLAITDKTAKDAFKDKIQDELDDKFGDKYYELERKLHFVREVWDWYLDWKRVRNKIIDPSDFESDGYPRCGRGSMCQNFMVIKNYPKPIDYHGAKWILFNPRTKKNVTYKMTGYKVEDNIYRCEDEKGKIVFFADHDDVVNSYDALFNVNKEISSGWWNRILISKQIIP